MNTATTEHDEQTCADCLENQLFAARSTIEVLTTALRDCVGSLKRLPDVDGAYRVTVIKQAQQALAALEPESEDGPSDYQLERRELWEPGRRAGC